jgi:glycosyltransferase involved in cell wall biosynthesis
LNESSVFVLPSLYEGHPKSLLEAMATGIPVIGTDVVGIRNLITSSTGFLCATNAISIRSAILKVLAAPDMAQEIGRSAARYIEDEFSLGVIAKLELENLCHLASVPKVSLRS